MGKCSPDILKTDGKMLPEISGRNFRMKTLQIWEIPECMPNPQIAGGPTEDRKAEIWNLIPQSIPNLQIVWGYSHSR